MKVLVDTNILLDVVLNRKLFVEHASLIWRLAELKEIADTSPPPASRIFTTSAGNTQEKKRPVILSPTS